MLCVLGEIVQDMLLQLFLLLSTVPAKACKQPVIHIGKPSVYIQIPVYLSFFIIWLIDQKRHRFLDGFDSDYLHIRILLLASL